MSCTDPHLLALAAFGGMVVLWWVMQFICWLGRIFWRGLNSPSN